MKKIFLALALLLTFGVSAQIRFYDSTTYVLVHAYGGTITFTKGAGWTLVPAARPASQINLMQGGQVVYSFLRTEVDTPSSSSVNNLIYQLGKIFGPAGTSSGPSANVNVTNSSLAVTSSTFATSTNILRLQRAVDSLKTNAIGSYGGMLDVLRLQRAVDSLKANITIANTAFTANAGTNLNTSALATTTNVAYVQRAIDSLKTNVIGAYGKMFDVLRLQRAVDSVKAMVASDTSLTTIKVQLAQLKANSAPQANIFKTVSTNNGGNTDIWVPAGGKKFRLLGYQIQVTPDAAYTPVGGSLNISLSDNGTILPFVLSTAVPGSIPANLGNTDMTPWVTLGGGFLSAAANNHLQINLSQGLNNGQVTVIVIGTEE